MKKYKPIPKAKIFTVHWYNPLFWISILLLPFIMFFIEGAKGFAESAQSIYNALKTFDLS
jgi:hypothetical protein